MSDYFIEFQNVSKSFDDKHVLRDISFGVKRGETLVILGVSGTGKSVTLMHIVGLIKPESGHVLVDGEEVSAMDEEQLISVRKKVSLIFQSGALFDSLTVAENVAFPLYEKNLSSKTELKEKEIQNRVDTILKELELTESADLLPGELSTGIKRRVAIGRALAAEPQSILYDEPTTMVDPLAAKIICDLIRKLQSAWAMTSIVVTHDIAFCARRVADRVAFLHEGKIRFLGTMEELYVTQDPFLKKFVEYDVGSLAELQSA